MESSTQMVFASMYRLRTSEGGKWDTKGDKLLIKDGIFLRSFVDHHNSTDNNLLFIVNEEKTEDFYEERERREEANNEKAKKQALTTADLVDAIVGAKEQKEVKPKATRGRKAKSNETTEEEDEN